MPTAKQRANWARFARMARSKSKARKARRTAARSVKRATPKRSPMARRRNTRKTKSRSRGSKSYGVLSMAVKANAVFQVVEPFISAGVIEAAKSKDPKAFIAALRTGGKEAASVANIIEALGPVAVLSIARKVARGLGAPNPRIGPVRVF